MKIDLTKSFAIILHLEKATDRLEKIKKITDKNIQPKFKFQFKQIFIQSGISSIDSKIQDNLFT
jgi:hypothetical protein